MIKKILMGLLVVSSLTFADHVKIIDADNPAKLQEKINAEIKGKKVKSIDFETTVWVSGLPAFMYWAMITFEGE